MCSSDLKRLKSLEQIARECGVDKAYLCQLFRRFDSDSPYQSLLRLKMKAAADDLQTQLAALLPKRFLVLTPWEQLRHLPRYLRAIGLRIDKLREDSARDAKLMAELAPLVVNFRRALAQRKGAIDPRLEEFRWMLEELRVSLFAQSLRTPMPVSIKRLQKAWDAIRDQ